LLRNDSNKILEPCQFYATYASPMKTPENPLLALQPARQLNSSSLLGGIADLVQFPINSSTEITPEFAGSGRHLLVPNTSLPFPGMNASSYGLRSLDEIDPVQLGTSAAQSTPSIPLSSAHPSQLATNGNFRSSYNRKDILQMKSSSTLVNTSKIFDQKLEKNVILSQVSRLNKVRAENKDFEVLETSNVFAKLERFSEDILLSAQYSPASSRNKS
jgi:hypothetical protein